MAKDTLLNLRNEIIYCIYVRNHTPEGTFAALVSAIHDLGMKVMIDVVYNHTSPDSLLVERRNGQ